MSFGFAGDGKSRSHVIANACLGTERRSTTSQAVKARPGLRAKGLTINPLVIR
jgi:hypothetical protein